MLGPRLVGVKSKVIGILGHGFWMEEVCYGSQTCDFYVLPTFSPSVCFPHAVDLSASCSCRPALSSIMGIQTPRTVAKINSHLNCFWLLVFSYSNSQQSAWTKLHSQNSHTKAGHGDAHLKLQGREGRDRKTLSPAVKPIQPVSKTKCNKTNKQADKPLTTIKHTQSPNIYRTEE